MNELNKLPKIFYSYLLQEKEKEHASLSAENDNLKEIFTSTNTPTTNRPQNAIICGSKTSRILQNARNTKNISETHCYLEFRAPEKNTTWSL